MKILLIENIDLNSDTSGGICIYLKNLINYLRSKNIDVELLARDEQGKNLKNIYNTSNNIIISKHKISHPLFLFILFFKAPFIQLTSNTIIHTQRPDLLVPFIFFGNKYPKICSLHGSHNLGVYLKRGKFQGFIYDLLTFIGFCISNMIIAVDEKTKSYYINKFPFIKNKIDIIPIGVDFSKYQPMNKKKVRNKYNLSEYDKILLYIGRLEKEKNIYFLIDVYENVKKYFKEAKLLLIGDGRQRQELIQYIASQSIRDVIFLGSIENDLMPEVINCSDVFIFASLFEGSPTVIKEVMACNIPVVSVDVGDVKELIGKSKYCYLAERDIKKFSEKIIMALQNKIPDFEIRDSIKNFDNFIFFNKLLKIYKSLKYFQRTI